MLSTSQKTRLFLNYIHKQMYSSSQSFERIIHNHFSDCQIEKAGGVRWCSEAPRTLGRIEWNIIANDSDFFCFSQTKLPSSLNDSIIQQNCCRCWHENGSFLNFQQFQFEGVDSNFFLPWSTSRWEFCFVHCLHVFFYLILKIKFRTKLTKAEIQKKPPKFSNTCYK